MQPTTTQRFPLEFPSLLASSVACYKSFFFPFLALAVITYLPFWVLSFFVGMELHELLDIIHGALLDMVIFLAFPTIFMERRVYPLATANLFQRFFTSGVLLALFQVGVLLVGLMFFFALSPGLIFLGVAPFLFLLFSGHYLILHNEDRLIDLRQNIKASAALVKQNFFPIFWNYLNISLFLLFPIFAFSIYYVLSHEEVLAFLKRIEAAQTPVLGLNEEMVTLIQKVSAEPAYLYTRAGLYLLLRPLKAIFLSFLFLAMLSKLNPSWAYSFLGILEKTPPQDETQQQGPSNPPTEN